MLKSSKKVVSRSGGTSARHFFCQRCDNKPRGFFAVALQVCLLLEQAGQMRKYGWDLAWSVKSAVRHSARTMANVLISSVRKDLEHESLDLYFKLEAAKRPFLSG